jgi:uncharacterized protein involved in response to NO
MSGNVSPLLSYAFRPFFLLGAAFAIVMVLLWIMALHAPMGLPPEMFYWHGHEMLVGFGMAAVAGFLLTAISRWTGRSPVQGRELVLLVAAWLLGRLAMGFAFAYPAWVAAVADMIFPVLLVYFVGRELIKGDSARNFPIVGIVGLLAALNLLYHLGRAGVTEGDDRTAVYLLIHLLLLLVAIIGGRIIPNFTTGWLRQNGHGTERLPASFMPLEVMTLVATVSTGIAAAYAPLSGVLSNALPWLAMLAAVMHAGRLACWRGLATRSNPLLFVLHFAYCWLPLGYLLTALAQWGYLPPTLALHALTMGVIGLMILAVTTRVALGHTGRALQASRAVVVAYWLLTLAVVARLAGTYAGGSYMVSVDVSALLWMAAFGIFVWVYWPVLTGPSAK